MSRAAILPIIDDWPTLRYWLKHFQSWSAVVDEVQVIINGPAATQVAALGAASPLATKCVFHTHTQRACHGEMLAIGIRATRCQMLFLCEEDAFVRDGAYVDRALRQVEDGGWDVFGSPRHTYSGELSKVADVRWPVAPLWTGEGGSVFQPCFLAVARARLLKTSMVLGPRTCPAGTHVPGLNLTLEASATFDTFGQASWELRDTGAHVRLVPQYKTFHIKEVARWRTHLGSLVDVPWFHVGNLSSKAYFRSGYIHKQREDPPGVDPMEVAKRCWWWLRFIETAPMFPGKGVHRQVMAQLCADGLVTPEQLALCGEAYGELITWEET